ncbi:hypothetical protein NCLIV_010940 [Neospora caninum Liverpool]|nr:hypothetical protein NCLIV_010940 [Neospora caninum Liverpool]CBZ50626.1 hypothetical protein NCLIV_010940 [Neospora caninum Liverpool]|eukprot:XP_003880659.1 hypothetical protein NCLIV_010940 [Neospora caninum Liverpool]
MPTHKLESRLPTHKSCGKTSRDAASVEAEAERRKNRRIEHQALPTSSGIEASRLSQTSKGQQQRKTDCDGPQMALTSADQGEGTSDNGAGLPRKQAACSGEVLETAAGEKHDDVKKILNSSSAVGVGRPTEETPSGTQTGVTLELQQVPKMLGLVKHLNPHCVFMSFKLETNADTLHGKARRSLRLYSCDMVVANLLHSRHQSVTVFVNPDDTAPPLEITADGGAGCLGDKEGRDGANDLLGAGSIEAQLVQLVNQLHAREQRKKAQMSHRQDI